MATNLLLDDELIKKAVKLGNHKTKRDAVNAALEEYVRVRKFDGWDDLLGKVEYYDELKRKPARARRSA
jgi:Arc/MetJ family transcription regulator